MSKKKKSFSFVGENPSDSGTETNGYNLPMVFVHFLFSFQLLLSGHLALIGQGGRQETGTLWQVEGESSVAELCRLH